MSDDAARVAAIRMYEVPGHRLREMTDEIQRLRSALAAAEARIEAAGAQLAEANERADMLDAARERWKSQCAAAEARIERALREHRQVTVQVGSQTHGGGPQYAERCSCGKRPCPTVAALAVPGQDH